MNMEVRSASENRRIVVYCEERSAMRLNQCDRTTIPLFDPVIARHCVIERAFSGARRDLARGGSSRHSKIVQHLHEEESNEDLSATFLSVDCLDY